MKKELISVIVPFYNVLAYLGEAIDSVFAQTYTNWEMLLVDDGSTDGSTALALEFARRYPDRIRYLQHPGGVNKGLPAARNLAVQAAKGTYLALLDADDRWLPAKLEAQMAIARAFPGVAMICGASKYWYSWADPQREDVVIQVGGQQDQVSKPPLAAVSLYPLGEGAAPCPCSILVKTTIARKYRGFEEGFTGPYQMYEDQAFFMKIYLQESIYISSVARDWYRQRPDSIMSQSSDHYHEIRYFFLRWLLRYLSQEALQLPAVEKKIKQAIWPYTHPFLHKLRTKFLAR